MIFVSHASSDDQFVNQLCQWLEEYGYQTWVDHMDVPAGKHWDDVAADALKHADAMILVLSPDSVSSYNVKVEYKEFLRLEKPLLPILLHPCEPPMLIRYLQMIDFQKRNQHRRQFERLVNDLGEIVSPDAFMEENDTARNRVNMGDDLLLQVRDEVIRKRLHSGHQIDFDQMLMVFPLADTTLAIDFERKNQILIGRADKKNKHFPDVDMTEYRAATHVSRSHAVIEQQGHDYWLCDLGSKNGTFIEQQRLPSDKFYKLRDGMVLHFGDTPVQIFFREG